MVTGPSRRCRTPDRRDAFNESHADIRCAVGFVRFARRNCNVWRHASRALAMFGMAARRCGPKPCVSLASVARP